MFIFRSVTAWLTLLFLVLIGIASTVSWLYVVPPLKDRLVQQKLNTLQRSAENLVWPAVPVLADPVDPNQWLYSPATVTRVPADELDQRLNARVIILDAGKLTVLYDSRPRQATFTPSSYPMIKEAASSDLIETGTVDISGSMFAATAVPVRGVIGSLITTKVVAVVFISSSLSDVYSAVSLVKRQILLATTLALVVTLVAGFVASYLIARRLKRIERGAEAIAGGDLNTTVTVRARDEIGQLATTFNVMGRRLQEAFSAIEYEKKSAETMLNTLSEGVIGLSADGVVLLYNPAAVHFLGAELHSGAAAADVFPEEVVSLWRDLQSGSPEEPAVFEFRSRTLEASAYPVGTGTDIHSIVVLRDVTQQARVERARRDFVANASHEFKTPLFSLSGFLELLDEEGVEPQERQEYLALMKEQVERLQALSLSLLDLSQVDAGAVNICAQPVDLTALAHSVAAEFHPRANERDLTIQVRGPSRLIATADEERVAQVLRALLDNAIKFSTDGGAISVTVGRNDGQAAITVADTGEGIPRSELPHVFERFYRGAMSRGTKSGTGLGLSIARDLTELMGGTITAASRAGHGSRFTIRLPLGNQAESGQPAAGEQRAAALAKQTGG